MKNIRQLLYKLKMFRTLRLYDRVALYFSNTRCEQCEVLTSEYIEIYRSKHYLCDPCHEHLYCECGQRLEDSYGQAGDGFCMVCR